MTSLSYLLAIASSITYGTADFLGGLTARRASVLAVLILSQGAGLVFIALVVAFMPAPQFSPGDYLWSAIAGLTGGGGVALLYLALAIGTMSTVAPTTAVCAIVVPVLVGLGLGERYGVITAIGILIAILAIILLSGGVGAPRSGSTALPIAVIAGILIGFFFVALERGGPGSGLWPLLISRSVSFTSFGIAAIVARARWRVPDRITTTLIVLSGITDVFANILYVLAVRRGSLGIVSTIASLYPASTVILARFILHERLRAAQWIGVACAGVAIVLIVGS